MKNLIRLFLILFVAGIAIGTHTSCSEDSDCSIAGRAMINCTLYRMPAPSETILQNDTLDSLTVTALGTDSIIINNQKKVHTLSLPLLLYIGFYRIYLLLCIPGRSDFM